MNLKTDFISQLQETFTGLKNEDLDSLVSENLICPFAIELPTAVLTQAQEAVRVLFSMRQQSSYLDYYKEHLSEKGLQDPGNKSIMMSYDFHLDPDQNLKLIEINTNAAFLILGHQMYKMKGHELPVKDFSPTEIQENIRTEMQLQGKDISSQFQISITDETPSEQRLYVEFLAYSELFKSFGWNSKIEDYRDLFKTSQPDFIYNRYTDFFLSESSSQSLYKKYLNKEICLSPNPFEYFLLADKQRLIDWLKPGFLEAHGVHGKDLELARTVLPLAYDLKPELADEVWTQRRKLFFKPKNAYGSKFSYRGASISRKSFDDVFSQDMIAQEYIPAPEKVFETPEGPQKFKFDLRCYAYQGRLQLVVARIYQGQVTNLRTTYGGFATVLFKN